MKTRGYSSYDPGGHRMARGWRYTKPSLLASAPLTLCVARVSIYYICLCVVCVFFLFILDIKFVGRTSRGHTGGRSLRIFHPPSFCGACLNFSREKDSAIPFLCRPRSRILCTDDLIVLPRWAFLFLFFSF